MPAGFDSPEESLAVPPIRAVGYKTRHPHWESYVQRCASGDQAALSALYDESSSLVYTIALNILHNSCDAEEVTVDVYRQVWNRANSYTLDRGSVASWLAIMARSRALDKRLSLLGEQRYEPISETLNRQLGDAALDPEAQAAQYQQKGKLVQALTLLPAEQSVLMRLAFFSGMSHSEIAAHVQVPLGTVKSRIRSAVVRLRGLLENQV